MTSYYKLIVGGAELTLDPGQQWSDEDLRAVLARDNPQTLPLHGGGGVTFLPGPGIVLLREDSHSQVF